MRKTLALGLYLAAGIASASTYGLGSKITPFSLEDQHGKAHRVDERVRAIILSHDMEAGEIIGRALARNGKRVLEKHRAVYLADLSGMPGFLRRMFVLPKLRERSYPMLLDTSGEIARQLPSREGFVALIFLSGLRVVSVEYVKDSSALIATLESPKRFASY